MDEVKTYINADLAKESYEDFCESAHNDFITDDILSQIEWLLLITQSKWKQVKHNESLKEVNVTDFDRSFLISANFGVDEKFLPPLGDYQVTPSMFPYLNLRIASVSDTIQFHKIKELRPDEKRNLNYSRKYVYDISMSYYKKNTESFYSIRNGFEVNPNFFDFNKCKENGKLSLNWLPNPIPLKKGYYYPKNALFYFDNDLIITFIRQLVMAYQVAMTYYYEWTIYVKEYDNIGLVIPINPNILKELYTTSLAKFDNKKAMLHFVRDYYRRKVANDKHDYSIYVHRYLRGENKFNYNGFSAEIIPPRYDLNRTKTKKQFIDHLN